MQRGSEVDFYELSDLSETEWDAPNGSRLQLPYSLFTDFKGHLSPVWTLRLQTPDGSQLHLWK
jgi:hypothetical protein